MSSLQLLFRDAATRVRSRPETVGIDRLWWESVDCEEAVGEDRRQAINAALREGCESIRVRQWPLPLPGKLPLDTHESLSGLSVQLWQAPRTSPRVWGSTPAGAARWRDPWTITSRADGLSPALTVAELRARDPDGPAKWTRVPIGNQETADWGSAVRVPLRGMRGEQALELLDNDLYTPFDLRLADEYAVVDSDGRSREGGPTWRDLMLRDRWTVAVYLRPRRWRYLIEVLAHFVVVTGFELVRHDQWYLRAYFDRPPVYPYRANVAATAGIPAMWHEYEGAYLAYDPAIEWAVTHSRAAKRLRAEIMADQWAGLCIAWILESVEPGATTIWAMPPQSGEIVCGLGTMTGAGDESILWVIARRSQGDRYPQRLLGQWWTDFFYAGGGA